MHCIVKGGPRRQVVEKQKSLTQIYVMITVISCRSFARTTSSTWDESGCHKRLGFRRAGWSPLGTTPVQVSRFRCDQQYQILPAYTQDGILLLRVFRGSADASLFEDFIEELLQHCEKYPEPKSVLIVDNASFHRTEKVEQMWVSRIDCLTNAVT